MIHGKVLLVVDVEVDSHQARPSNPWIRSGQSLPPELSVRAKIHILELNDDCECQKPVWSFSMWWFNTSPTPSAGSWRWSLVWQPGADRPTLPCWILGVGCTWALPWWDGGDCDHHDVGQRSGHGGDDHGQLWQPIPMALHWVEVVGVVVWVLRHSIDLQVRKVWRLFVILEHAMQT